MIFPFLFQIPFQSFVFCLIRGVTRKECVTKDILQYILLALWFYLPACTVIFAYSLYILVWYVFYSVTRKPFWTP